MLFSSLTFLFFFLPLCCVLYFISKKTVKNKILLIFSLLFYAWGEPKYIVLMLLTVLISYLGGLLINYFDNKKHLKLKKLTFVISIILILGSLVYFKYTDFIIENINNILKLNISAKNIVLPIGISFYTFQVLSYVIDLYRKKIKVQKSFFDLALYISFFPQLIAGPIVTYETIEDQLENRNESLEKIVEGIERFIIGLGKKVIIANQMALIADAFYNSPTLKEYSIIIIIIGVLSYTLQIYFDFSGYSDMAIGLGKIFGFEFLENFNYPYIAKNITDFWRRWHISLTTFFREYVYIPLGGNRVKKWRWIINMAIVWFLTGLWHGAAWNFILWGVYYLILLLLEKTLLKKVIDKIPNWLGMIITFILVNIGWILFRVNNLSDIALIINHTSTINLTTFITKNPDVILSLVIMPFALFLSFNIMKEIDDKLKETRIYSIFKKIVLLGIFVVCISFLVSSMYNPFIYFRF